VQVTLRHWEVPLVILDWSDDPAAAGTRLAELLSREQATAPDLSGTPPTALTLIRTGPDSTVFIWRSHHILLDGDSVNIVFDEAWTRYIALREGSPEPTLPAQVSIADYAAWAAARDVAADEAYWRQEMAGLASATPVPSGAADPARTGAGVLHFRAPAELATSLAGAAAAHRVTAGALCHAAWAVLLARHSGRDDVVFGSVVTGRSPLVPGIDAMVGLLMNTLPLRVRLVPGAPDWLSDVHQRLVDLREHVHSGLTEVQRLSAVPTGRRLFDSIVVFHNVRHDRWPDPAGLRMLDTSDASETGYPLVLDVIWDDGLALDLNYERTDYDVDDVQRVLDEYVTVLRAIAEDPQSVLAGLELSGAPAPSTTPVAATRTGYVAPRTDRERLLAGIWADVLGAGRVGVMDNFFDLGGDSILSIQIVARAHAAGWSVTTRQIFSRPTITELAAVMVPAVVAPSDGTVAAAFADAGLSALELNPFLPEGHDVEDVYPLSSMQGGMLFGTLVDPDGGANFQQMVMVIEGDLDVPTLAVAWRAVVARHAVLRSTFAWADLSHPVQIVHRQAPVDIEHLVWPGRVADASILDRLQTLLREERERGFDLEAEPPQRLQVIEHGPQSYRLVWHYHHMILDGRSTATVVRELLATYAALRAGDPPSEVDATTSFRSYIAWDRGRNRESDRRYWRGALAGAPAPTPAPFARPDAEPGPAGNLTLVAPAPLLERLRALAQRHRITVGAVLHAAYGLLLSRHCDQPEVLFGTTLAGRSGPLPGVDSIVGMLMNTLPLRLSAEPGTTVRDYLRDTHERYAALREHEHSAIGDLRLSAGPASSTAMFGSVFVYDNAPVDLSEPPGLRIREEDGYSQPGCPIVLSATLSEHLLLQLIHQGGRVTPRDARRLLEEYLGILAGLCEEPERLADVAVEPRPEVALTPIQQWFTGLAIPHDHFNQSMLLYSPAPVDPVRLDYAVRTLVAHHEGLRTRLRRDHDGHWRQTIATEATVAPVRVVDLSGLAATEREPALVRAADEAHRELNLADGPLLRAVLFAEGATARLLVVVHHLVVDIVSWPTLVEDLSCAYQELPLPPATSTFAEWAERLRGYALGADFDAEAAYWRDRPAVDATVPVDGTAGANTEEQVDTLTVTLPAPQTRTLTTAPGSTYELLLAAMTLTVAGWTGRDEVRFDVETHGRELLFDDIDLSRTVGWFTAMSPFEARLAGRDPVAARAAVHTRQTAVAHHGIGYGLWRYLRGGVDTDSSLVFNYHGQDITPGQSGPFTPVDGPAGADRAATGARRHLVEVDAVIASDELVVTFRYARNRHHRDTVAQVADQFLAAVRALLAHEAPSAAPGLPLDRPYAASGAVGTASLAVDPALLPATATARLGAAWALLTGRYTDSLDEDQTIAALLDTAPAPDPSLRIERGERTELVLEYASGRVDHATASRALRHLAHVLAQLATADPTRPVRDLEVLTESERGQILLDWNATAVPYPRTDTLSNRIAYWAATTPDATALVTVDRRVITFDELNTATNRLAHRLRRHGVGPETLVGVCLGHSVELVVAMLAVLRAGGAYVPLDPEHPLDRRGYMLADSRATVLIGRTGDGAPTGFAGTFLTLDDLDDLADLTDGPANPPTVPVDPDNLAYVIYTSGSTGRPKGVQVTQQGLTNFLTWACGQWDSEDGGALLTGSVTFDAAVWNMWVPLFGGHRLTVIAPDPSLGSLAAALSGGSDVNWLVVTPSHLNILRSILPDGAVEWRGMFAAGGEEIHPATASETHRLAPYARVCNVYGPTETVVVCTLFDIPDDHDPSRAVPVGTPIANTQIYLLDSEFRPVPVGVGGELYIGGDGVSRGYHNRPALTAESFVPNPYGPAGSRLYRSGDLARYREDGNIEYQGRRDHQVKIRGHRIELGEIESRLAAHPAVAEVAVIARVAEEEGHKRLVAYVVLSAPATPEDLREYLRQDLPDHMVPALVLPIDQMPLGATGKVDRAALPEPEDARFAGPGRRPARHALEQALMDAWSATLGTSVLDADADFFEVGGDSLLAIGLVSRIRKAGLSVTLRQIYEYRTPAALAASGVVTAVSAKRWELSTWFPELMATHRVPGVAVALVGPDGVRAAGFGDSGTGAVGPDTVFQIGSMTKTVTALVTVELAHRGVLDLDADVNGYLTGGWRLTGPVTLRQLLSHTSGLNAAKYRLFERDEPIPTLGDILAGRPPARNGALRLVAEPGTYEYASSNFDVVEQVLVDVTGTDIAVLADELVLGPLGLRATTFDPPADRAALGHDASGVPLPSGWRVVPERASGALWSSARDMAVLWDHLARAAAGSAGPVTVSVAQELLTEVGGNGYGLGALALRSGERRIVGHPGDTEGYNGMAFLDRDTGIGIVVLTNGDGGQNLLAEVEREVFAGGFPFDLVVDTESRNLP
jgi:amino acid adenylation domain-containing protein/non-ribosomal peptide synthase protein (TIGR01720 family)